MSRNAFRVPKDIGEEQEEIKHGRRAVVAFHPFTPTGTTHCHFLSVYLREKRWKGGVESDRKGIYIDANKYSNHSRVQVGKKKVDRGRRKKPFSERQMEIKKLTVLEFDSINGRHAHLVVGVYIYMKHFGCKENGSSS